MSVFAGRAVNPFAVNAPLHIILSALPCIVGESLRHLPVGKAVAGLVFGIRYRFLYRECVLNRGVLPAVRVLALEVGVTVSTP